MKQNPNRTVVPDMAMPERCEITAPRTLLILIRQAIRMENSLDSIPLFFKKAALEKVQAIYRKHGKVPPVVNFRSRGEKIRK